MQKPEDAEKQWLYVKNAHSDWGMPDITALNSAVAVNDAQAARNEARVILQAPVESSSNKEAPANNASQDVSQISTVSPVDFDLGLFLADEQVFLEAGQGAVGAEFFAAVGRFGGGREDFYDDDRGFDDLLLAVELLQAVFAGDHHVRVEIALFFAQPEFDTFYKGTAGSAFEVGAQFGEEVAGNYVVAD